MKYRTADLFVQQAMPLAATRVIDINLNDVISRLMLRWEVTKTQAGMSAEAWQDMVRIELVDGSDVIHSTTGGQNQALCIFDRKVPTMNYGVHINANTQATFYGIDFGRFLHDPVLAFDPKRFKNPQLRITYNSALSDNGAITGNLDIRAECFDEKIPSPIGFLTAKEYYNAAPPAAGFRDIDLPVDHPYRRMLIQGFVTRFEPWWVVDWARLDEDNDKRVIFDTHLGDYYRHRIGVDLPVEQKLICMPPGAAINMFTQGTDFWNFLTGTGQVNGVTFGQGANGRGGFFAVVASGAMQFQGMARGYLPNHCWNFPFGDDRDIDDWYDVTKVGHLRLRLRTGGGAGVGTEAVVLQQVRMY